MMSDARERHLDGVLLVLPETPQPHLKRERKAAPPEESNGRARAAMERSPAWVSSKKKNHTKKEHSSQNTWKQHVIIAHV